MGVSAGEGPARESEEAARRELFAVLAHELRSPIGAILGFEELLSEGILGEMPPGSTDALARIRGSARQLLDLVAGLSDLATDAPATPVTLEPVDADVMVEDVLHALRPEADGRGARVTRADGPALPVIRTDAERVRRALQLTLMAAIKASAGAALALHASATPQQLTLRIHGCRLDPLKDDPDHSLHAPDHAHLTGAGLRIGMARTAITPLGGSLLIVPEPPHSSVILTLPAAAPPA